MDTHVITPVIPSVFLSHASGFNVFLKLENTQPSGSFKDRGIGRLVAHSLANITGDQIRVCSSSGGNAGLAAANAARMNNVPCTVCVPETTSSGTVERIKKFGAEVVVHGPYWSEADRYLREVIIPESKEKTIYCHPFDGELIWEGHSSLISELKDQLPSTVTKPDAIVISAGGAGLYCGIATGCQKLGWADVPIVVVEPVGAPCFHNSIKEGKIIHIPPKTRVTTLGSSYVPQRALDLAQAQPTFPVLVTDDQAITAAKNFTDEHKFMVEPACGATLATFYEPEILRKAIPTLSETSNIVAVVCGGSSTSLRDYHTS